LGDLGKKERLILKFVFKTWRASEKKERFISKHIFKT
jgi:hypothetical protein